MEKVYEIIQKMDSWARKDQSDCPDITEDYIEGWRNALYMLERELKMEEKKNGKIF